MDRSEIVAGLRSFLHLAGEAGEDVGALVLEAGETHDHPIELHDSMIGVHTHMHPAMGQGDAATHSHSHSHNGDASHSHTHPASTTYLENDFDLSTSVSLRMSDGQALPAWQLYHRIGDWGDHPQYGHIVFTRKMGDEIISNFQKNTLGRGVPLDAQHKTDFGGAALAWAKEFRWGKVGAGLPGQPEPDGQGDLLFVKMDYTQMGQQALRDELYRHQSPQYHPNWNGKGAVAMAMAATNNPHLRGNRTLQGIEQPILLDDGLRRGAMPPENQNPNPNDPNPADPNRGLNPDTEARIAALELQAKEATERAQKAEARADETAAAVRLRDEEIHRQSVSSWADKARTTGVPEVSVKKATAILLQTNPKLDGVISLDADKPDDKVNLFDAVVSLMGDFAVLNGGQGYPLGTGGGTRPPNVTPGSADVQLSEEQTKAIDDTVDYLATLIPQAPASRNGSGASAGK